MTDKSTNEKAPIRELLARYADATLSALKERNKQARKRNRLGKRQHQQAVLNYEQAERQYLIEKAHLHPSFRLSATEMLSSEPDFVNDPEQAAEAKFLADKGVKVDQRVIRLKLHLKGQAEYLRPSLVIRASEKNTDDERILSMTDLLYFVELNNVDLSGEPHSFLAFFVYRDKTTLPVVHKLQLTQQSESTLLRWEVGHLDTAYAKSHKVIKNLNNADGCAALFSDRHDAES